MTVGKESVSHDRLPDAHGATPRHDAAGTSMAGRLV
jgi:hypothetical protein